MTTEFYYDRSFSRAIVNAADQSVVPQFFGNWLHNNFDDHPSIGPLQCGRNYESPIGPDGRATVIYWWASLFVQIPRPAGATLTSAVFHLQDPPPASYPPPNIPVTMYGCRRCYTFDGSAFSPNPYPPYGALSRPISIPWVDPGPINPGGDLWSLTYGGFPIAWHGYNGSWINTPVFGLVDGVAWTWNVTSLFNDILSTATFDNPWIHLLVYTTHPSPIDQSVAAFGPDVGPPPVPLNYLEITP